MKRKMKPLRIVIVVVFVAALTAVGLEFGVSRDQAASTFAVAYTVPPMSWDVFGAHGSR